MTTSIAADSIRRALRSTIVVLWIAALPVAAQPPADDDEHVDFTGLDIQASIGWDGHVEQNAPIPLAFLLTNQSQTDLDAELVIADPSTRQRLVLGRVFVGAGSVKRFSTIESLADWSECVATFEDDVRTLWRRELPLLSGADTSGHRNYLLYVTDNSRRPVIPEGSAAAGDGSVYEPALLTGRQVRPLLVRSWQIPQHYGPMTVAQGILFDEALDPDAINDAQWDALARWVSLGGTVFVHQQSEAIVKRIADAAPMAVGPAVQSDALAVRRCGAGSVQIYSSPLFQADSTETERAILDAASRLPGFSALPLLSDLRFGYVRSENANISRTWIITLFLWYVVLSGGVTLFLFRLGRRSLAIYVVTVIAGTSVLAGMLGAKLKTTPGDLRFASVTEATDGGLVQFVRLDAQSAGGRESLVTVAGPDVEAQAVDSDTETLYGYYYSYGQTAQSQRHLPPFSEQSNLLPDEPGTWQLKATTTPWGTRQVYATGFQPDVPPLDLTLTCVLQNGSIEGDAALDGRFYLRVTALNRSGLPLQECSLVIAQGKVRNILDGTAYPGWMPTITTNGIQGLQSAAFDTAVGKASLAVSSPDSPVEIDVWIRTQLREEWSSDWTAMGSVQRSMRPASPGGISVFVIATLGSSPVVQLDSARTNFEQEETMHLFLQRIPDDQLPPELLSVHRVKLEADLQALRAQQEEQKARLDPQIPQP